MLDSTSTYPPPDDTPAAVSSPSAPVETRHRKVAILGFGATAKDCPWQDPSWELWAMNGWWRAAEPDHGVKAPEDRYTLWFDMHTLEYTREYGQLAKIDGLQEAWLRKEHPFPIFMLDAEPGLPSVVRFPIEGLITTLGRDYFTSTVAYAIAFALAQDNIAEIGLWGIDLTHDTEYADQRPCAEYWIGRAEARGIKVTTHEDSALMRQRGRYGYDDAHPVVKELRAFISTHIERTAQAMDKNRAQIETFVKQLQTDDGGMQALHGVLNRLDVWSRGGKIR